MPKRVRKLSCLQHRRQSKFNDQVARETSLMDRYNSSRRLFSITRVNFFQKDDSQPRLKGQLQNKKVSREKASQNKTKINAPTRNSKNRIDHLMRVSKDLSLSLV